MKKFKNKPNIEQQKIYSATSSYWKIRQEKNNIDLFQNVASRVPAYNDFLKINHIDPKKIRTSQDFLLVPQINKKNYIQKYSLKDLCWDGTIEKPLVLTATSGSTGKPSYFVRGSNLDEQYSISIQKYLQASSHGYGKPILVIICFGMGIWIGGVITYKAYEIASNRCNFPVSIITPGINKKEIFAALKKLSPQYHQTVLVGYAPFLKDIVDQSQSEGVELKKLRVRFMFAAEAVTEEVRDYLAKAAGVKDICRDFMNVYGSADMGAMADEDCTSILIKRLIRNSEGISNDLFSSINKTPTLAQYNPEFINFESVGGEILLTGDSAIPLVRYSIGDNGGVYTHDELTTKLKNSGIDVSAEIVKRGLQECASQLPFVFIYERIDFSTSLYGLNIYPEWIKKAIVSSDMSHYSSGKFTMTTKYDEDNNQYLEVNIELKKNIRVSELAKRKAVHTLISHLMHSSSEYRELLHQLKDRAHPRVVFWTSEDSLYFQPGIKQKWVK